MGILRKAMNEALGLDVGDIVQLRDYQLQDPKQKIWNGAKGEVISISNGKVSIRITDIKGSNVQYSIKWMGKLDRALKHTIIAEMGEFIMFRDK